MEADVVYDNPRTRRREWYRRGMCIASITEDLLDLNSHMPAFEYNKVKAGDKSKLPEALQIQLGSS